jgi:UDP-N-acetylmuramoylalanine--D-glutamate ligase
MHTNFSGKKITVMGLGLLGRSLGDAKYLARCGAELTVTDLKSESELYSSVKELSDFPNVRFVLGEHRLEDFQNRDMILKSAGVPLDSPYILEAKKNGIPVEMSASLFVRMSGVEVVGVTGTRGKSTVTHLLYSILKSLNRKVLLGGNVRGVANLPFLEEVTPDTLAVMELDSWQLQGFGEAGISPKTAVFTNFLSDHMNYYKGDRQKYFDDKANIFRYQSAKDDLVVTAGALGAIEELYRGVPEATLHIVTGNAVPDSWQIQLPGEHNKENVALAVKAASLLGVSKEDIKRSVEDFKPIEGRLQFVRSVRGVRIYNDNNATSPDATIAGIQALSEKTGSKNIILIIGGSDKDIELAPLIDVIKKSVKSIILLPGSGSDRIRPLITSDFGGKLMDAQSVEQAVHYAMEDVEETDILLFSPTFTSYSMFNNEYERNDEFLRVVGELK